jgi:hypothetical protein
MSRAPHGDHPCAVLEDEVDAAAGGPQAVEPALLEHVVGGAVVFAAQAQPHPPRIGRWVVADNRHLDAQVIAQPAPRLLAHHGPAA